LGCIKKAVLRSGMKGSPTWKSKKRILAHFVSKRLRNLSKDGSFPTSHTLLGGGREAGDKDSIGPKFGGGGGAKMGGIALHGSFSSFKRRGNVIGVYPSCCGEEGRSRRLSFGGEGIQQKYSFLIGVR